MPNKTPTHTDDQARDPREQPHHQQPPRRIGAGDPRSPDANASGRELQGGPPGSEPGHRGSSRGSSMQGELQRAKGAPQGANQGGAPRGGSRMEPSHQPHGNNHHVSKHASNQQRGGHDKRD